MEITYKGYTITPNSERQPDGRWLPVADLAITQRGMVTTKPPLRAKAPEARMTQAEADSAAVQMAKTWIDANERDAMSAGAPAPMAEVPLPSEPAAARRTATREPEILEVSRRTYPSEHAPGRGVEMLVVLVAGEIGDYAAYAGQGSPEWVARFGNPMSFEEACVHFPDAQLKRAEYQS
jgi:hypothetical protein